jgi:hypothetical protein
MHCHNHASWVEAQKTAWHWSGEANYGFKLSFLFPLHPLQASTEVIYAANAPPLFMHLMKTPCQPLAVLQSRVLHSKDL